MKEYESLKSQLEALEYPHVYFFKFIAPNKNDNVAKVLPLYDTTTELKLKKSANGKFVSVSNKQVMLSAVDIIEIYKKASEIEGLIALNMITDLLIVSLIILTLIIAYKLLLRLSKGRVDANEYCVLYSTETFAVKGGEFYFNVRGH